MSILSNDPLAMAMEQFTALMPTTDGTSNWGNVNCQLTGRDKQIINGTLEATVNFINRHTLSANGGHVSDDLGMTQGVESFGSTHRATVASSIGVNEIKELCLAAKVPADKLGSAVLAVAQLLNMIGNAGGATRYRETYLTTNPLKKTSADPQRGEVHLNLSDYLASPSLMTEGSEAFGFNSDTTTPDIRAAITVTLLQFQRGVLKRIVHTQPASQPIVEWKIEQNQVYDLLKSMNSNHTVRNSQEHQIPAINLLAAAGIISNTLKPIQLQKSVDGANDDLVCDDWIRPNRRINAFDLALRPGTVGHNQTDYSDLIAENVKLRGVLVSLTKGSTTELFVLKTTGLAKERLMMELNTELSSNRSTILRHPFPLTAAKKVATIEGTELKAESGPSTLLADMTDADCLYLNLSAAPMVNLMEGTVEGLVSATLRGFTTNPTGSLSAAVLDMLNTVKVDVVGFNLDLKWSEENLRKSVIAGRMLTRTMTFEIPPGRNYLVDFSLQQQAPAQVLAFTTELIALGQDDRALRVITDEMKQVYDRVHNENKALAAYEMFQKIGFDYVASQLVRPIVYLGTLDIGEVQNIRSADYPGDVRQYAENIILNLVSKLLNDSYYGYRLNAGEKPTFRVVTSRLIMDNLFAIPHIHPQMQAIGDARPADGDDVEYRRILASGVVFEFVCTTFDAFRDQILVIPYRASNPGDPLNWGTNHDCGMFTANYVPQYDQGAWRRVLANARAQLFPTNPIGMVIQVRDISTFVDMSQVLRVMNDTEPFTEVTEA